MTRIFIRNGRTWNEVPNGPFPITPAQLEACRASFQAELAAAPALGGARMSPQTAARDILRTQVPQLSDFDRMMVGFAVTSHTVRTEEL